MKDQIDILYINKHLQSLSKDDKVLLMLSGGKDSTACMFILKKCGFDVTALHFYHNWSYQLSSEEAVRLCKDMNVPLIKMDFTRQFFSAVEGFKGGRPCLLCKKEMYNIVIKYSLENNIKYICVGDNANDQTTIGRIIKYEREKNPDKLIISKYLGNELGIRIPNSVKIIRPLLNFGTNEVENFLTRHGIKVARNNCTGDKYFSYSREGCPAQFHDPGSPITEENLNALYKYGSLTTEFARSRNIRASIHWPSKFVVTIPKGYEDEVIQFLKMGGLQISQEIKSENNSFYRYPINILDINIKIIEQEEILEALFARFLERLGILDYLIFRNHSDFTRIWHYQFDSGMMKTAILHDSKILHIDIISTLPIQDILLENLIIEVFRSRNYIQYKG